MKKITVLATGGTIAGVGESGKASGYKPGTLTADDLIKSVPQISEIADIKAVQVCNVNSDDITAENELSDEALKEVSKILLESASSSAQDSIQAYKDSINVLKLKNLKMHHAKLLQDIKEISTCNPNYTKNPDYIKKMKQSREIIVKMENLKFVQR